MRKLHLAEILKFVNVNILNFEILVTHSNLRSLSKICDSYQRCQHSIVCIKGNLRTSPKYEQNKHRQIMIRQSL